VPVCPVNNRIALGQNQASSKKDIRPSVRINAPTELHYYALGNAKSPPICRANKNPSFTAISRRITELAHTRSARVYWALSLIGA